MLVAVLDSCGMHRRASPVLSCSRALLRASITVALATAACPALAAEAPPVYVDVEMDGTGWTGENCEGGEWTLGWSGGVAVEPGPLSDLLKSYTAFDTTQPNQGDVRPARFDAKPVTCRDNRGNVVLRANVAASGSNRVQMTVSLADDGTVGSPSFSFTADELGVCRVQGPGISMEQPVMASVNTAQLNTISPALRITQQDLDRGFDKSYRFDGTVIGAAPMCMGATLRRGTLRMRYKSGEEDPSVTMDACLHLAKNEVRTLTAAGTPAGGTYRFRTSGSVFAVRGIGGNTGEARGQAPGKGDVTVDYERRGRTASATVAGSVVEVVGINGGAPIPKLGLYGANGLKLSGTHDFPLRLDPVDGFVTMTVEDDTLASVVNTSSRVQIQPVKVGSTTMQAKTLCGTPLGPRFPFEIVRCDDDVKAQLRTQQQQLKSQVDQLVKRITQLTANAEFQEAATEIAQSTKDFAVKTGESIIGTLTLAQGKKLEFAAKRGVRLSKEAIVNAQRIAVVSTTYDVGDILSDAGEATESLDDWQKVGKPILSTVLLIADNEALSLGKTYGEAYLAAEKFSRYLGTLAGVAEQLEQLEPQLDRAVKDYVRIATRLEYCERPSGTQQPPPKSPAPPKPTDPTPIPVETETPVEIPVPEEPVPPAPEEPIPPPTQEPGQKVYGLACRIQDLRAPGVAQRLQALRQYVLATRTSPVSPVSPTEPTPLESFTNVTIDTALARATELNTLKGFAHDLGTLKSIADAQARQLADARSGLQQWQGALDRMKAANAGSAEQSLAAFGDFRRARDEFVLDAARHGDAGLDAMMETDECRDRLEVKVDQVRARYN
jgi:outer membrane biosynthesis protein TonB